MVNLNSVEGIESLIEKRTKPLKKQVKELTNLVNELKEAINYTRCCEELCDCKKLPKGEIAISSKALTDPNWES
jgi:hypothetical protein